MYITAILYSCSQMYLVTVTDVLNLNSTTKHCTRNTILSGDCLSDYRTYTSYLLRLIIISINFSIRNTE